MSIYINCPACNRICKAPDDTAGQEVRCPTCAEIFVARDPKAGPAPGADPATQFHIITCPFCSKITQSPSNLLGKQVQCPSCSATFTATLDGKPPADKPIDWFYATNNQQNGPVPWSQLFNLVQAGVLKPTDLIWTDGMASWEPASQKKGLFADAPAPAPEPNQKLKIFISYRRDDNPYATHHLRDCLAVHFGKESVFMDVDSIPYGVDFVEHLAGEVQKCDCFLAMIGDRWLDVVCEDGPYQGQRRLEDEHDFVRIEIESALARRIPVIPVLVGRAHMPRERDLPETLKKLARMNAAEVRAGADMETQIARLLRAIEKMKK